MSTVTEAQQYLVNLLAARQKIVLVGRPGTAKTARIKQAAEILGADLFISRVAENERVDMVGAMVADSEAGITRILPLREIRDIMRPKERLTIWLWDDLGHASQELWGALHKYHDKGVLPDNVIICATTNRPEDSCGVSRVPESLIRSRFDMTFEICLPDTAGQFGSPNAPAFLLPWITTPTRKADGMGWEQAESEMGNFLAYAECAGWPEELVEFHRATFGRLIYTWEPGLPIGIRAADYRAWETVARIMPIDSSVRTFTAIVGGPVAREFAAFLDLKRELPSLAEIVTNPSGTIVPECGPATWCLFCAWVIKAAPSITDNDLNSIMHYIGRITNRPAQFLTVAQLERRFQDRVRNLPEFTKWFMANKDCWTI